MSPSTPDSRVKILFQVNPFVSNASGSPWKEADPDVPAIHDAAYRLIANALEQMRMGGTGTSVVLTGEPGSGKTHLLGRLRRALELGESQGRGETIYIYVRCNASASTIWRHVRAAVASDLLTAAGGAPSRLNVLMRSRADQISSIPSGNLRRVLVALSEHRHVQAAAAWLRGEPQPEAELAALGVGVEKDDEDRNREMEARGMVNALLGFLAPTPTVICFDQVEALATYKGDEAGFHAMAQLVSLLVDSHDHLLLVSCVVSAFEDLFDRLQNGADRDRWMKEKATLRRIEKTQAIDLVQARLDAASGLVEQRKKRPGEPLWPLSEKDLDPLFEQTGVSLPRTILQHCKNRFQDLMTPPGVLVELTPVPRFLSGQYQRCLVNARSLPGNGDKVLTECLPWLLQTSRLPMLGTQGELGTYAKLAFRKNETMVAVALLYASGNELTHRLRRIESHWRPDTAELLMLRDAAVTPGPRGAKLLEQIRARGAREVYPTPEALAALRAIQDLITSARSGDLAHDGETITESEVTEWVLENPDPHVSALRDDLAGPARPEDPVLAGLAEFVDEKKVVNVEAAAIKLNVSVEEIKACANRHPLRFGLLSGPPVVVFQFVEAVGAPPSSNA